MTDLQAMVTKATPNRVVPSMKVLALNVRFKVLQRTLLTLLRCFSKK